MKRFEQFIKEDLINKPLPEMDFEDVIPEQKIYDEFKKFGYDAFDVVYDNVNLEITVSPKSFALDGGFPKNFSQQMEEIQQAIGADDFHFTQTFQVVFLFNKDKYPELIPKK